jgi:hypothetical protein
MAVSPEKGTASHGNSSICRFGVACRSWNCSAGRSHIWEQVRVLGRETTDEPQKSQPAALFSTMQALATSLIETVCLRNDVYRSGLVQEDQHFLGFSGRAL